jgi:hypothetical protein
MVDIEPYTKNYGSRVFIDVNGIQASLLVLQDYSPQSHDKKVT